ncbi:MAG: AAA family ATPase [Deltaproteobacteria bacterium]|nr:AAA family ATPase [Deltaproteobacteria bacterium]
MLTRLVVRNFKRFDEIDVELGKTVVLIGPNNSGKTTALQALALWELGVRRWNEKRRGKSSPEKRPGVTINRKDLISIPVPGANLFWRDLHVRNVVRVGGRPRTTNVRIDVLVEGVTKGQSWSCGLEFDYANEESIYCRPLTTREGRQPERMPVPDESGRVRVSFLPPMSGLAAIEPKLESGRVNVLIGEGQTAQVLRNLCFQLCSEQGKAEAWKIVCEKIRSLFGVELEPPLHVTERGEILMSYREPSGPRLDLSCAGRGLQQTLLILAYLYGNPETVLLIDEPDAHLEILRQRQLYNLITSLADQLNSQIIAASHSEVVLNEAADRDIVIAFVGKPHRIDDRGSQVLKALKDIGFDQYYQAEQTGWVLYIEGPTDLAILQAFAEKLDHGAGDYLRAPFVSYVETNRPNKAEEHYYGLREAKRDLQGIAIFDRLEKDLRQTEDFVQTMWRRREIENYLCYRDVLLSYAEHDLPDDLFGRAQAQERRGLMAEAIEEITAALRKLRKPDPWSPDIKASDEFLEPLFDLYFEKVKLPNLLRKTDYHILARLVPTGLIDPEVTEKLDMIVSVAGRAKPRED